MNEFTENRTLHCRGVALKMQTDGAKLGLDPNEAFLVGWLHDAGYSCGDNRTHAKKAGLLLKRNGYRYWKEVYSHGTPDGLFSSMGVLLNIADMSISSQGAEVSFGKRLEDVIVRYGIESLQYKECSEMVSLLVQTPEWKTLAESTDG